LSEFYTIEPLSGDAPRSPPVYGQTNLYIDQTWFSCTIKKSLINKADPVKSLDCDMLSNHCLNSILGITDVRTDDRVDFVGGIRGTGELEKRCTEDCVAAFAMHPCTMDQIFAVADAGLIMPPKCTWYEPKPRSGFVVNVFKE
jgi:uncharacterized protein (DUF1015 family)